LPHFARRTPTDISAGLSPEEQSSPPPPSIDVGRKRNLTVAWILERIHGGQLITREVLILHRVPFPPQEPILARRVMAAALTAIDATGIDGPVSEHLEPPSRKPASRA
jgi:phage FluMu gp28-like protein